MEKLYTPQEIAAMFGVSMNTAYRYIQKMEHYSQPCLRVKESVLREYMDANTVYPEGKRWESKPLQYR